MEPSATGSIEIEGPYGLAATLRRTAVWGTDPTIRFFGEHEVHCAFRAPSGPAAVRYRALDAGERCVVAVEAWGPGAEEALALAPDHLGAHDESWRTESDHPIVGPLLEDTRHVRFGRTLRVLERLVAMVIGQKVTAAGAAESWRELVYRYGERAPGPLELWIPPSADTLRGLAYFDLHPMNLERRRAETILFAARRAKRLEGLRELDFAAAYARLVAFPGIGAWTAGHVLSGALGDADAVPLADYHYPHIVAYALEGRRRGTDEEMVAALEPFRPFRGRALMAIVRGGEGPPRRGPRLSIRNIRHM
jgi:3-methyladenine DNA glycosylase/8-oxoguanine DNA glycosylase